MVKLICLKGLPGSGKSTEAFRLVKEDGFKRVNKDDLRAMIDSGKWSKANEDNIFKMEELLAISMLSRGMSVVVDDTNFAHEDTWKEIAESFGAEFEVKFFDVPVMECIERDSKRGDKSVGGEVIMRMYNQYLAKKLPYNKDLPQCFIFDIDGTLATMKGRSPYDYSKVSTDLVNESVANIFDCIRSNHEYKIFVASGRSSDCREETLAWLEDNDIFHDGLFMRPAGDKRKDSEIKREIYEQHIKDKYNVVAVFDDRNQVVDLWRSLGLTCCQVNYGYF